ncbi:hypothetical protein [Clostridium pasteurianum]|uniref:Uncharacterized protein n=1 Tax=Clostridium pasteurianum BC1 TaxID=86416 RepID=R4K1E7_CLOPA|nr:hypothetical protein [Clostridium pasteurianum]AGK96393.1 hypothetical protein Clopa_1418 [Clostridium pasteurianum BC1]
MKNRWASGVSLVIILMLVGVGIYQEALTSKRSSGGGSMSLKSIVNFKNMLKNYLIKACYSNWMVLYESNSFKNKFLKLLYFFCSGAKVT